MLARLLRGAVKGAVVAITVGLALQLGLGWTRTAGLLGFLVAMGSGATAAALGGPAPWRQGGLIETLIKVVAGLAGGAVVQWLASHYAEWNLPFSLLGSPAGTPWHAIPLLVCAAPAILLGTIVELDAGDSEPKQTKPAKAAAPPARPRNTHRAR